jgi:hypothetical protein
MSRQFPEASWWHKLERAKTHLDAANELIAGSVAPGRISARVESREENGSWVYTAHHDWKQPTSLTPAIGDFLFNLQCALDHIAAANTISPDARGNFLIYTLDVRDPTSPESRSRPRWHRGWKDFEERTNPKVFPVIESMQPFMTSTHDGTNPKDTALAILNRLHNADKHKALSIIDLGMTNLEGFVKLPNGFVTPITGDRMRPDEMLPNGKRFLSYSYNLVVELSGNIKLAVGAAGETGHHEIPTSLDLIFEEVSACLGAIESAM